MADKHIASSFSLPEFESSSEFRINTSDFTKENFSALIRDMEITENLEREEHERRMECMTQILGAFNLQDAQSHSPTSITSVPRTPTPELSIVKDFNENSHALGIQPRAKPFLSEMSFDPDEMYFNYGNANNKPERQVKRPRLLLKANYSSKFKECGVGPISEISLREKEVPKTHVNQGVEFCWLNGNLSKLVCIVCQILHAKKKCKRLKKGTSKKPAAAKKNQVKSLAKLMDGMTL